MTILAREAAAWVPTVLFICFFGVTFWVVIRRDIVMAIFYAVLFLYTVFTQIAYLLYPARFTLLNTQEFYSISDLHRYVGFVCLSFLAIFCLFVAVGARGEHPHLRLASSRLSSDLSWGAFQAIVLAQTMLSALVLYLYGGSLSYSGQESFKSNPAFFYLFYAHSIVLVVVFSLLEVRRERTRRLFLVFSGCANALVFLLLSVKTGQRSELVAVLIAVLTIRWVRTPPERRWRAIVTTVAALTLLFVLGFAIRFTRGQSIDLSTFVSRSASMVQYCHQCGPTDPFDPQNLILEDYSGPSVTLLYSMVHDVVEPKQVVISVLGNSLILGNVPTLGEVVADRIAPNGGGFGYYILAEGFNAMGWWGIIYNALVFVGGLRLWGTLRNTTDVSWDHFITGLLTLGIFDVVRSQSSFFIKGILVLIIPGTLLYLLGRGRALRWFPERTSSER